MLCQGGGSEIAAAEEGETIKQGLATEGWSRRFPKKTLSRLFVVGGSHGGTKWIPFPLPPLSAWRTPSRPNITIGPTSADASRILAIFRPSYFIPQNLHMSQPQSHGRNHSHFHPLKEPWGWGGTMKGLTSWADVTWATLWCLASPLKLDSFRSCWEPSCLGIASPSHPPKPSGKRGGSPVRCKRTLKKGHGKFQPLLEASWFWLRKSWL